MSQTDPDEDFGEEYFGEDEVADEEEISDSMKMPDEEEGFESGDLMTDEWQTPGLTEEANEVTGDGNNQTSGNDIVTGTFDDLVLDQQLIEAANDAWKVFISTADSREAAGEAIYAAVFDSAPSLQSLFTSPRAVQAMKFMNSLSGFVTALNDPPKLKILVETLAFSHLHLDVTVPRVMIFRDAILDLFKVEIAEKFTQAATEGWLKLLNYVGGAIIFVKANYAERITILLKSWKEASSGNEKSGSQQEGSNSDSDAEQQETKRAMKAKEPKKSIRQMLKPRDKKKLKDAAGGGAQAANGGNKTEGDGERLGKDNAAQSVPTTYPEMFLFNAAVMGFGTSAWMNEVLSCFDNIVTNVANSGRLQEECDILALRISRVAKGGVKLQEYKACMLASLRSLLPKSWDSAHEVAWTWLWENVERLIYRVQGKPPIWEKALSKFLEGLDEEQRFEFRKEIYSRFFALAPAGQDFFKQSNTYLHFIADKVLGMTLELYQNPVKMVDEISSVGLRHVGYGIPTELFGPFVTACVEALNLRTVDEVTVESYRWSLGLTAKMLVRTITEGSTIVMKAINQNSQKLLNKAIGSAPRGERASWMLIVQVGTRDISPLAWAIESGNLEAATSVIKDLLTFRADRERYYYCADDLFKRHPDIVKLLCEQAPPLLPILFDGLIWRSRLTENGMRRVNYYLKHLLVDDEGNFNNTLRLICSTRDPKLVCHPILILVSDLVWSNAASRSFLYGKSWFLLTLIVFTTTQSVLQHIDEEDSTSKQEEAKRICIFAGRVFIYLFSLTEMLFSHIRNAVKAYRGKNTVKVFMVIPIPDYLTKWQDAASLFLTFSLVLMLALEPILWCVNHTDGKIFEEHCEARDSMRFAYTFFSMLAMFFYYALLIDLTAVSTRISAFVLVCVKMLSEVALFLGALAATTLMFSSAISVLKQEDEDFAGIHKGLLALFSQVTGTYSAAHYIRLQKEPLVLATVFLFLIFTLILMLNLLIAQLSCAYSSVYEDMVGYARLERSDIIVEIMPSVPVVRWKRFLDSLKLHKKLELNEGDVGPSGGIQVKEPASANPTTIDMIRRFGGSTSTEMPWPEDDGQQPDDEEDRFDRMEKLMQKTFAKISQGGGGAHGKGGRGGKLNSADGSNGSIVPPNSGGTDGSDQYEE